MWLFSYAHKNGKIWTEVRKVGDSMKQVKILHCADLHFDTPFKELTKEVSENSKEELLEVFKNIIDLTIKENVEVLLIAGDVFDNLTVNFE